MNLREPADPPLVVTLKNLVIAVDPESGVERWRHLARAPVTRIFLVEGRLFAATGHELHCLDYRTGALLGSIDLGFLVTAGFVRGARLFVAGKGSAACIALDGLVLWKCDAENVHSIFSDEEDDHMRLKATSGAGRELWAAELKGKATYARCAGLLLDGFVAQPDLE